MKRFSFIFMSVLAFITAAFLISCDTGLGEIVDIQAPEVSVTRMICPKEPTPEDPKDYVEKDSFETTIYTKQSVTFYGESYDNVGVTGVYAEVKWLGDPDYSFLADAKLSGTNWVLELNFPKEGACWLKFVAADKKHNYGSKSSKVVTLFVDNNAPVIGEAWYIDRKVNGIQYGLQGLADLKKTLSDDENLTNPSNKDVAQNGVFDICGSLTDATGIANTNLSISLYNEEGSCIKGNIGVSSETSSNYAPKFTINGSELGLPVSGKHYYQVRYSAQDLVTDPAPNIVKDQEIVMGWFLWWPESDNPRFSIANLEKGSSTMTVHTGDSLNITVFDDDALKGKVECVLVNSKNEEVEKEEETIKSDTERDCNVILKAPAIPQTLTLKVAAQDVYNKSIPPKNITVYVTDDFVPTLILTSPENNQIPEVAGTDANIHFKGITLDKAGCTSLEFVWVPDSVASTADAKKLKAVEILNSISSHTAPSGSVTKTEKDGCSIWSAKLISAGVEGDFKKHNFSFDLSLMNDFGADKTKDKYFVARVGREDGNHSDTDIKLAADNILPEIEPVNPAGNMAIIDKDKDLTIKFRGKKSNGLKMKTDTYKLSYVAPDGTATLIEDCLYDSVEDVFKSPVISKMQLDAFASANINPKYRYEVEDVLGNNNSGIYQFIISSSPQIKTVTSAAPEKCKMGDDIYINVSFSKPVTCTSAATLKLKGIINNSVTPKITADDVVPAEYSSGSGSTTLVFKYTVKAGDTSTELQVYNEANVGPISGISSDSVHLNTLKDSDNLQEKRKDKPITIDGIVPNVTSVKLECSDAETANLANGILGNVFNSVTYLKAGRTITATVKTDKAVSVQGSPKFYLQTGSDKMELAWQSVSADGQTIIFSKKITDKEVNGRYSYYKNSYLGETYKVLKDDYGNELAVSKETGSQDTSLVVDTVKPVTPVVKKEDGTTNLAAGKYKNEVKFKLSTAETTGVTVQYSKDGGSNWTNYSAGETVTLNEDANLVARVIDYAGNISDYSKPIKLEVNSTFPDFTVECTNSDGRYKAGTVLKFKVYFANTVDIDSNSSAAITLSAGTGTITAGAKAEITPESKGTNKTEATFEYTVREGDDFTLKVAKEGVNLSGITDKYGVVWTEAKKLSVDYTRADLHCDTVLPYVVSMTPQGTRSTQNNLNAYTNAKQIKITFNEPVSVNTGKIYLRQTSGWAIPPMLTAEDFNKVLNAVKLATIDTSITNNLTGSQVLYMDGQEDGESLYGSVTGPANDRYHGTAQSIGPYKKMTNGVDNDGNPDLSVKYVLDFGVDIWNSSNSTKEYFGITYEPHDSTDGLSYHHLSKAGFVNVVTPTNHITTDTIRYVLEQANYHQRSMAVNSTYVEKDSSDATGKTYILNFPEGLLGDSKLPDGREWELVIEKGSFMDETGNKFAELSTDNFILIKDGNSSTGNNSFMSAGVSKPVIRVDRYSYGLGIKQPTGINGSTISYEQIGVKSIDSAECIAGGGTHTPTAKVGVRIDTESKGANIRYSMNTVTKTKKDSTTSYHTDDGGNLVSYTSNSTQQLPSDPTGDGATNVIFLAGSGNLESANDDNGNSIFQSCKQYIKADALYSSSVKSLIAQEGIFQTVANFDQPRHYGTFNDIYNQGSGRQDVNIHGSTGFDVSPSISPFPLRDQPVSSAYMRRTYQINDQYYWISYEVLVDASYSMYVFGRQNWRDYNQYGVNNYANGWHDWAVSYAVMKAGEFSRCTGIRSWPGKCDPTDRADQYIIGR